ncbi:MAG: DUF58 domain-containing protein [Phycisphaerales bacterium]|nr:MAG: DUF58 domain-containing protein [Phycisphaerales bacterium]
MMIPKDLLKKIRRIEIRTSHLVNDALAGQYHSAFKGRGMEFQEVRQYQVGDDVRTIDWNVSARYGEPFVKLFREERELTVMLLVDMSRSQQFGTNEQLKRELIAELCATLAFSAIKNNDKVGLMCFANEVEKYVPASKGTSHVLRVIRELLAFQPAGTGTSISAALEHFNRVSRRRAVVFLVSDFQDRGYENALRIAKRRNDMILIKVSDRRELALPRAGLVELLDAESGHTMIADTASPRWRSAYARLAEDAAAEQDRLFRSMNVDCVRVQTGESFVEPLVTFFRKRELRMGR